MPWAKFYNINYSRQIFKCLIERLQSKYTYRIIAKSSYLNWSDSFTTKLAYLNYPNKLNKTWSFNTNIFVLIDSIYLNRFFNCTPFKKLQLKKILLSIWNDHYLTIGHILQYQVLLYIIVITHFKNYIEIFRNF